VSTLNLSLYTIGGGLAQAWDLFAPAMFQSLEDASQVYRLTKPASREQYDPCRTNVCHAHLGPEAGILGASLLPFFQ
jgi:glucokinase